MKKKLVCMILCALFLFAIVPMQAMAVDVLNIFAITGLTLPVDGATPDFTADIVQSHNCKVISVQWMDLWTDTYMDENDRFVMETDEDGNQHNYRVLITVEVFEGNEVSSDQLYLTINDSENGSEYELWGNISNNDRTQLTIEGDYIPSVHICAGGEATCVEKAVCTVCGQVYGELAPENHQYADAYSDSEDGHYWDCIWCGETSELESHVYGNDGNGICVFCQFQIPQETAPENTQPVETQPVETQPVATEPQDDPVNTLPQQGNNNTPSGDDQVETPKPTPNRTKELILVAGLVVVGAGGATGVVFFRRRRRGKTTLKPGKTTLDEVGKTTLDTAGKTTLDEAGKTTLDTTGKTTLDEVGKTTLDTAGKTTLDEVGKTTLKPGKTTLDEVGKTTLDTAGKTTLDEVGKTTLDTAGKTTLDEVGKTTLKPGKTTLDEVGKTTLDTAGKTTLDTAGKTTLDEVGKTTLDTAGKTTLDEVGKTTLDTAGKTTLDEVGKTTLDTAGKTTLDTAGKTTLDTAGKTTLDTAGKTTLDTAGKTTLKPGKTTLDEIGKTTLDPNSKTTL